MFLSRRTTREEADVFDVQNVDEIRDYNWLLSRNGIDVRIKKQKEFSVKGPLDADMNPLPDRLYVFVTYELLNGSYERMGRKNPRPKDLRAKKDEPAPAGKRPKIVPRDRMTKEEVAAAAGIIFDNEGHPVINVEAQPAPEPPPKVVSLDLYRAQEEEPKGESLVLTDEQRARIKVRTEEIAKELKAKYESAEGTGIRLNKRKLMAEAKKRAMYEVMTPAQRAAMTDFVVESAREDAMKRSAKKRPPEPEE